MTKIVPRQFLAAEQMISGPNQRVYRRISKLRTLMNGLIGRSASGLR
jgi:hypothetical protein